MQPPRALFWDISPTTKTNGKARSPSPQFLDLVQGNFWTLENIFPILLGHSAFFPLNLGSASAAPLCILISAVDFQVRLGNPFPGTGRAAQPPWFCPSCTTNRKMILGMTWPGGRRVAAPVEGKAGGPASAEWSRGGPGRKGRGSDGGFGGGPGMDFSPSPGLARWAPPRVPARGGRGPSGARRAPRAVGRFCVGAGRF